MILQKSVKTYTPIRKYYGGDDVYESRYKKVANLFFDEALTKKENKNINKRMQLFQKVKYEFNVSNTYPTPENADEYEWDLYYEKENSPAWSSYSKQRFTYFIIDEVLTANRPAYDFNTGEQVPIQKIREHLGESKDTIMIENWDSDFSEYQEVVVENPIRLNEIQSFIFIEDWYVDTISMQINKKIIGIAPVRHYYRDEDYDQENVIKKTLFVVYFDEKPENYLLTKNIESINFLNESQNFRNDTTERYFESKNITDFNFQNEFFNKFSSLDIYGDYYNSETNKSYSKLHSKLKKDSIINELPTKDIVGIHCSEKWMFNPETYEFTKEIFQYSPFIKFYREYDYDKEDPRFTKIEYILNKPETINENKLIHFKTVKYEHIYDDYDNYLEYNHSFEEYNPLFFDSYNTTTFKQRILDDALSGKITVYDFETDTKLDSAKLSQNLIIYTEFIETWEGNIEEILTTLSSYDIKSIIFIEDWFIDPTTFQIKKEVVGIAPVFYYYADSNPENELLKKIPFVIYFDGRKGF